MTPPRGMRAQWGEHRRILLVGGVVHSPVVPFSTALLIDDGAIAWLGEDSAAAAYRDTADVIVDLEGAFVAPGFVDAHVHATSTGLLLTGLDLTSTRSAEDLLDRVQRRATLAGGTPILGHGWDETTWDDPALPSREALDRAAGGSPVYLSRIDVHSALVSSALIERANAVPTLDGWSSDGPVSRIAHHRVREAAMSLITPIQRAEAQRVMRAHAASLGIVAVHEMAGPTISSPDDLASLLELADAEPGPLVAGYWGELSVEGGIETAQALGAIGVAGDLFMDGALGSHTACLHSPYADEPHSTGAAYLSADQVARHLLDATDAGLQGGFHVIGDAACSSVTEGLRLAAEQIGSGPLRASGHRLEHAEMLSDADIAVLADLAVVASMQPMFDALWGGPNGMYEQRLGRERATAMNRLASLTAAGVPVAFGSDAPVTELGPWQAIHAAMTHGQVGQRISARAAFNAHSRGGWRASGHAGVGVLAPGAPAHLALWRVDELDVQAPDSRVAGWSTDPRSGTPQLPVLDGSNWPECLATVVHGRVVHSATGRAWW